MPPQKPPHTDTKKVTLEDLEQRVGNLETWLKRLIDASGLTLAALLTFAFFLGSAYNKVSVASDKTDKLYQVVAVDKDSLQTRTGVIESKLSSIDTKLTSMDANLTELVKFRERTWSTVKPAPTPTPEP
jgi:hypothetical protein